MRARQPNTAWTVDPDFDVARSWQNNVQFEHALSDRYSVSVGASYVEGYNLPLVTNINLINPIGTLPDGIPVFAATPINATTRVDPRYNVINSTQSLGESTYKNMTLQFTRRHMNGIGFDFAYTLGKSEDTAPITSTLVSAGRRRPRRSDQSRSRPRPQHPRSAAHLLRQHRGDAALSIATERPARLLNDNVFGLALQFASGIPVNLRSNLELNNDGTASDRPSGVPRNSLHLPARYNVDARYSRKFRIQGDMAAEVIAEIKNVFNTMQVGERQRDDSDQHARRAARRAADERRTAAADRRLRTASVPARFQVHLLRRHHEFLTKPRA